MAMARKNIPLTARTTTICIGTAMALAIWGQCRSARAITLAPSENGSLLGTPSPTGAILASSQSQITFTGGNTTISQSLTSNVLLDSNTGTLDFIYTVSDLPFGHPGEIGQVSISGFSQTALDADYIVGAGVQPSAVSRSPDGDTVIFQSWEYASLFPGSSPLIIRTDATNYSQASTLALAEFGQTLSTQTYGPQFNAGAVPEVGSFTALAVGAWMLTLRRGRAILR
jgi:hypothetical protein